jgi:hypothetical protein
VFPSGVHTFVLVGHEYPLLHGQGDPGVDGAAHVPQSIPVGT